MSMDWFRWWHGTANDPKFRLVARDSNIPVASVIGVWAVILESASLNNPRGTIEIDFEVLEYQIGIDNAKKIIDSMCKRGMLVDVTPCNANVTPCSNDVTLQNVTRFYNVKNWEKRQPKREREDDSAERVRKHREAAKALKENNNTPINNDVTPCNAMKRLDKEEIREDKDKTNLKEKNKKEKSPSGSRLSKDWVIPAEWIEWAVQSKEGWNSKLAAEESLVFKDYWIGKSGPNAAKADWEATWRNWVRKSNSTTNQSFNNKKGGYYDRRAETAATARAILTPSDDYGAFPEGGETYDGTATSIVD